MLGLLPLHCTESGSRTPFDFLVDLPVRIYMNLSCVTRIHEQVFHYRV